MKVLVTGAGALLGQGIIRSLRASSLDTHIIAVDPSPLSAGLYWADEAHLIPLATDRAYEERMRELLGRTRPDAVLVGTDVELHFFAQHREALERDFDTHVIVSSPEVVAIADDKYRTYEFLRDHGFAHPDSSLPDDAEALIARVGFPLIVKPRVGARSVGVHLVRDRAELARRLGEVDGAVVQECVAETAGEYTAGALCFDGEVDSTIVMRRDLRDGNTYRAFVEPFPELNEQVRAFAAALRPHGPANFQFRVDGGRAKVFEINGRFSGTTPFRMLVGFNEVEHTLRRIVLGESPGALQARPAIILRHWTETVLDPSQVLA